MMILLSVWTRERNDEINNERVRITTWFLTVKRDVEISSTHAHATDMFENINWTNDLRKEQ